MPLLLYTSQAYLISCVLVHSLSVRLYSGISMKKPWVGLWYLCRGIDLQGRGVVQLPMTAICPLMGISSPTLYQWLREGRRAGAFRKYSRRANTLQIWLGSRNKLCLRLGLRSWGTVAIVPLTDILNRTLLKQHATSAITQTLQERSRYARRNKLNERERRCFRIPDASDIVNIPQQSCVKLVAGQVAGIVHVGASRIFTDERFVPFGAKQTSIAEELGISDRTVRRHVAGAGVRRKQIVQTKEEYRTIRGQLQNDTVYCGDDKHKLVIWYDYNHRGQAVLYEPNGITTSSRSGGHPITRERFFTYRGRVWMYRCNLYDLDCHLISTRKARRRYNYLLAQLEENPPPKN